MAGTGASAAGGAAAGAAAGTGGRLDEEAAWAAIVAGYGEEPPDPPGARPFRSVEDLALPEFDARADGDRPARGASADDRRKADGGKVDSRTAEDRTTDDGTTGDRTSGDRTVEGPDTGDGTAQARTEDGGAAAGDTPEDDGPAAAARPALGGSVVFAPGVGPRDYRLADPDAPAGGEGAATPAEAADDDEGHFVPPEPPPLPEADSAAKFGWLGVLGGPVLMLLAVLLQWDMTWWLTTLCVGGFLGGFATLVSRMRDEDEDGDDDPGRGAVV
ncbi:hypothetical protein [Streptomyces changanensis]|uniref:Uncharacterized protein n=1 Tax=Streptomyces kanasensis TaxID=936756 RepID=A0A124ED23_9ACTN|nr:hypothetical protein ATE80_07510 [Streptomyces kanasensis]